MAKKDTSKTIGMVLNIAEMKLIKNVLEFYEGNEIQSSHINYEKFYQLLLKVQKFLKKVK